LPGCPTLSLSSKPSYFFTGKFHDLINSLVYIDLKVIFFANFWRNKTAAKELPALEILRAWFGGGERN